MDIDEDSLTFSPPEQPSPQIQHRRLKRLKKSNSKSDNTPSMLPDDSLLFSSVDFSKLEALEKSSQTFDINDSISSGDPILSQESLSQGVDSEDVNEKEDTMEFETDKLVPKAKRVLEFNDDVTNDVGSTGEKHADIGSEKNETVNVGKNFIEKTDDEKKKKKRKVKSDKGNESKTIASLSNKRTEEKKRNAYLKELHAESQRLLRETRDATFKPIPAVQKPISSVLEKIRKRKLEISKKAMSANSRSFGYGENISLREESMNLDVSNEERREESELKTVESDTLAPLTVEENGVNAPDINEPKDAADQTSQDYNCEKISLHTSEFRAPVDDTQDLFDDSEVNETSAEQQENQQGTPMEELAPSIPAMNLTLDSVPDDDDSSSEEEDNDKENVNPHPRETADGSSSPSADPVMNFVDDEAEEDDSDNDHAGLKETEEDEDFEDLEELNDMIATGYEEKPSDNERRNELHQKWLEQQDATGTDNLMQRLKCGQALKDTFLADDEGDEEFDDEDDEEFDDEAKEDSVPMNSSKVNIKKAKQMILESFPVKEDVYESDEEDTHRMRVHSLIRNEEQATIISPAEDENSREVFGLIKKLNIVSHDKKKPKASSIFDSVLNGTNSNSSSKSSFIGRVSSNSIQSTHKQGSGTFRSFIFGRDDSNSRSSISLSEDSSDIVSQETRTTRTFTAKYSNSHNIFSGKIKDASTSGTSLLDILKRKPQSQVCHQQNKVDLTKSIFGLRAPNRRQPIRK